MGSRRFSWPRVGSLSSVNRSEVKERGNLHFGPDEWFQVKLGGPMLPMLFTARDRQPLELCLTCLEVERGPRTIRPQCMPRT